MKRWGLVLVLLSACVSTEPGPVTYRDRTVPIASKAVFEPADFAGVWRVVAEFSDQRPDCEPVLSVDRDMIFFGCDAGIAYAGGPATYLGQGRYDVDGEPLWVLWLSHDGEAAVIGRPDGTAGAILARETISADRYNAARQILDFNGYDLTQLHRN